MNGILLIDKEKGKTSRDVVNLVSKRLNTKKIGHAGTLDPLATGLLVIGVGKATKILDLLTLDTKEYIAKVKMGIETDTLDITGNVLNQQERFSLEKDKLEKVIHSFQKKYIQTVPKYSAVKINGKRLYEYARCNIEIELPKREVNILEIKLLDYNKENKEFTFQALVSKGTYIRSLIKDISESLNIPCTMMELRRIRSGKFSILNSIKIDDIQENSFIKIEDALDYPKVVLRDEILLKKVRNGNLISLDNQSQRVIILDKNNHLLAVYDKINFNLYKSFKVF